MEGCEGLTHDVKLEAIYVCAAVVVSISVFAVAIVTQQPPEELRLR